MRVIAGQFRGRRLRAPDDRAVRPTSDRLRETLFNILSHSQQPSLVGAHMVDLFAGTGAVGIEALSRGARHVTFVEKAPKSLSLLKSNLATMKAEDKAIVLAKDATKLPAPALEHGPVEIAFLDPPYHKGLADLALSSLRDKGWLAPNALVVAETARDETLSLSEGFGLFDQRQMADSRLWFLRFTPLG
ncbi:DNA methyltransferase [Iodidimonas muriae]|uniref:DNA methyltransferase n=1 Tax=Iodidimonas muriae TaxID=261467 RepID=A0ABQ2LEQ8_9PROT|nr:16S rRNA (guanine(966)-N(2))-methyltransferase RsmD [Iodidimonas muriae]GER08261.1 DNA methyltransferase [Kordiimonadales bacterium JCM 17843]GGO12617.1 DNA methyltransferase [Iodidimonas muriae]